MPVKTTSLGLMTNKLNKQIMIDEIKLQIKLNSDNNEWVRSDSYEGGWLDGYERALEMLGLNIEKGFYDEHK